MAWRPVRKLTQTLSRLAKRVEKLADDLADSLVTPEVDNRRIPDRPPPWVDRLRIADRPLPALKLWDGDFTDPDAQLKRDVYDHIIGFHLPRTNRDRVGYNVENKMTDAQLDMVVKLDSNQYRQLASVMPELWYH